MLCPFNRLMRDALQDKRAVGAFNAGNMEMVIGIVKAAEESQVPIILQIAEKRLTHSPLELVAPMLLQAAMRAKVEIAVELDHGSSQYNIERSMNFGFNTVMFDGSEMPIAENIKKTKAIVDNAHQRGVAVEAEIGVVGGSEGGADLQANCADISEIIALGSQSGCDALAVAIGNAHGHYHGIPKLNFDLLQKAHDALPDLPLVLHGGSGIAPCDFRKAISMGISKINIATANFDAIALGALHYSQGLSEADVNYFKLNEAVIEEVYKTTMAHIAIFNNRD